MAGAAVSAPETLELDDMQGLILRGYGRLPEACLLLYRVAQPAAARAWLAGLVPRLTTAASAPAASALNLALTVPGMAALGLPGEVAESFPLEVREGMVTEHRQPGAGRRRRERARALGVRRSGHPRAAPAAAGLRGRCRGAGGAGGGARRRRGKGRPRRAAAARDQQHRPGRALRLPRRHLPAADRRASARPPPSDDQVVRAGELVLGYRDEYGLYADRPLVPAAARPGSVLPPDVEGSGAHDLGRNGSYLVLRQLEQDVPGFWRFVDRVGGRRAEPDRRWRPRWSAAGRAARRWCWRPMPTIPASSATALNAFRYHRDDPLGRAARWASHIRRTNPRDSLDPDPGSSGSVAVGKHHRLLRRGRSYGTRLTIDQALAGRRRRRAARPLLHVPEHEPGPPVRVRPADLGEQPQVRGRSTTSPIRSLAPGGSFSMPADAGAAAGDRRAPLRDRARRRLLPAARRCARCATWPALSGRRAAGTPPRRRARSARRGSSLAQPRQLPVHAPAGAALVAQRPVLGQAVPGVVGEDAGEGHLLGRVEASGGGMRSVAAGTRGDSFVGHSTAAFSIGIRNGSVCTCRQDVELDVLARPASPPSQSAGSCRAGAAAAAGRACATLGRGWNEYCIAWPSPSR